VKDLDRTVIYTNNPESERENVSKKQNLNTKENIIICAYAPSLRYNLDLISNPNPNPNPTPRKIFNLACDANNVKIADYKQKKICKFSVIIDYNQVIT
jgi:hypothetical protein